MIQKDIIYGNIELGGIYEEIIQSEDFSRLKDITQTAFITLQYPELEKETRYEHSIGVYYLMCRTLNNLERKLSAYGLHISKEEREMAKLAALLHDIGHGINSHLLEKITGISHEQRGIDIMKDSSTQVHQIIAKYYGKDFINNLIEFMECIYGKGKLSVDVELGEGNIVPLKGMLASLISHNIDLDRIDYLVRESTYTGLGTLTDYQNLINSFECVLAGNQIVIGIPEEKKYLLEANILERTRNYSKIYLCDLDSIANHGFKQLLRELSLHPEEVPDIVPEAIRKFLTQADAEFTNQEYMQLTNQPLKQAIELIASQTQNEKIRYLCNYYKNAKKDYQILYNGKSEEYIRRLLQSIIPNFPKDSQCLFSESRKIKPYKKTKFGSTNIITKAGIQNFEDLPSAVSLEPITRPVMAINPEILRLELEMPQEEFQNRYTDILQDIITNQSKPIQEFELKYVMADKGVCVEDIEKLLEEKYSIVSTTTYISSDSYYDSIEKFSLLEEGEALRIRKGETQYKGEKCREYKNKRITYKTYEADGEEVYTNRKKQEEIGNTTEIKDYKEFLASIGKSEELTKILTVQGYRKLITIMLGDQPIDISFGVANYLNCIYQVPGDISTIEIRPRDNKIVGRFLLLQIKKELEEVFPDLKPLLSNANIYEIGMIESYDKYKKGNIRNKTAEEFEIEHPESAKQLETIIREVKKKRCMSLSNTLLKPDSER